MKTVKKILDYNDDGKIDSKDLKDVILLPVLNMLEYIKLDSDLFWILAGIVICAEVVLEQQKEKGSE